LKFETHLLLTTA